MRKWIKRLFSVVDAAYTIIDFVAFLAFLPFPLVLTSSNVLRGFIATGAIVGAVCGYYFSLAWAGKGRNACKRQRTIRAILFPLPAVAGLFLISVVNPNFARRHASLIWLREELVTSPWWTDALIGLAMFGSVFLLVSSITLSSPKLWNARLRDLTEVPISAEREMPKAATVLSVLIASPSDVQKERELLTDVVLRWNAAHSGDSRMVLQPIRWETHAYPASGDRPQAIINKQIVDDCDILMGVFWSRLGTATGVAPSGTAEEIERLRRRGKHVLLYFSTADLPQTHDPKQFQLLKDYQRTLEKDTLYWTFKSLDELDRLATQHLSKVVHAIAATLKPGP